MPDQGGPKRRGKKMPRRKSIPGEPRTRRKLLDRLDDPGVMALALSWASAGLSNRDISAKLECTPCALDRVLQRKPLIRRRFERRRLQIVEEAIAGLRGKFARDWRACAFYLERKRRDEYGTANANAVDIRKLFGLLSKLAAGINEVIPEANRPAVDAIVADFVEKLSQDGEDDEPEGTPG